MVFTGSFLGGEAMEEEKNIPFYPSHINTLKIGYGKEATDLLRFREFIEIRENGQRLTGELPKGMFRLSYAVIEEELNFSRWTARKIMKYFLDNGIIECVEKSRKKGEGSLYIYTTVYYYYNRPNNRPNDRPNDRPNLSSISNGSEGIDRPNDRPNDRHSKKHILNTYIKNNNMSDSKESDEPPGAFKDSINTNKTTKSSKTKRATKVFEENSIEYQLSKKLYQYVLEVKPKTRKPDLQKWSKDFDLILRRDERSLEDLENVIDWIFNGDSNNSNFWKKNISSPGALRGTTKNGADKFAEIYSQMENDTNYYRPSQKELEKELPPISDEEIFNI